MGLDSALSRHVAFPLSDILRRTSSLKYYSILEKTQWFPISQIEDIQQKKLRALILHAYENVPYYRNMFKNANLIPDDIKTTHDLSKLPLLTKYTIKKNANSIVSNNTLKRYKFYSGGTTGEPLVSYKDRGPISWSLGAAYRGWDWGGYRLGDRYATLWRSPDTINKYNKFHNHIQNIVRRNMFLPSFYLNEETLSENIRKLNTYKPKIIRASPSAAYGMAEFMESNGIEYIKPTAIFTAAEKLYNFQREKIETVFGCEVFDSYGSNEIRSISYECAEHNGYHISAENVIVEFIRDGENVSSGLGDIIITDLNNYAMPFIRYKIGDVGVATDEVCACGRGLPLMKSIEGRHNSIVITKDNKLLSSSFFADVLTNIDFIKQFQIVQDLPEFIQVHIVCTHNINQKELDYVLSIIEHNVCDMDFKVECVDSISPARSGKLQLVISKIPLNL